MYRAQQGSVDPTAVFLPILMATSASTLTGLLAVAYVQKINLLDKTIVFYFSAFAILLAALASFMLSLPTEQMATTSSLLRNFILFGIIMLFLSVGWFKKVDVYDAFI